MPAAFAQPIDDMHVREIEGDSLFSLLQRQPVGH
jgi:hypothetical protein